MTPSPEQLRAHYFKSDRDQWRFALALWSVCVALFLAIDYLLFGTASSVFSLAVPRLLLVVMSALLWWRLPRIKALHVAERWMIVWVVALCLQALEHELIRPPDYFGHYPYQVLAALVFFAAVPMAWQKQFAVMALYVALSLIILFVHKQPPSPAYTSSIAVVLLLTLICGTLISMRVRRYRVVALAAILDLEHQAKTDPLTGVPNRRAFMDQIEVDVSQHIKDRDPLCVLMMDVDRFKAINDRHGHEAGDRLLKALAGRIQHSGYAFDHFARLGGEEFCFAVRGRGVDESVAIAEQLRTLVSTQPFTVNGDAYPVTVSVGLAQLGAPHATADATLRRADDALYRAKALGRNRVEIAE